MIPVHKQVYLNIHIQVHIRVGAHNRAKSAHQNHPEPGGIHTLLTHAAISMTTTWIPVC